MKISIGTNIKEGPWGGGNLFAKNLKIFLEENGHDVYTNLLVDDLDLILITEPRKTSESSAFTHIDVKKYLDYVNDKTIVVHRINECDERKNTNYVNKYIIQANKIADQTIFVSEWLKSVYVKQGINEKNNDVILAGSNRDIFNSNNFTPWTSDKKLRIVTHHWGANWNKGFEVYDKLDKLIGLDNWKDKIEFNYIGNLPKKFKFENANHIAPLSGTELANAIKQNHLYITGSLNEPSGNHHIEAAQCGLPILYIDSGGVKEYCEGFGIKYDVSNLHEAISIFMKDSKLYYENMKNYPFSSERMCKDFENLFFDLLEKREEIYSTRYYEKNRNLIGKGLYLFLRNFKNYSR
tara:strand:+ start:2940 stop:3992 length:1053 start_codon:yes stop_codon:yes gene_type:complete